MSEALPEISDSELYGAEADYAGDAEYTGDAEYAGDASFPEATRSDARRQRDRQRQMILARQRQAQLRARPPARRPRAPAAAAPPTRQTIAAIRGDIRNLNLDTQVDLDTLRRRLDEANKRGDRATYSAMLSIIGNQALATFDPSLGGHPVVGALIRFAPAVLLPQSSRKPQGIGGVLTSPPVITGGALAAILLFGHYVNAPQGVQDVIVSTPSPVAVGGKFTGTPVDGRGNEVSGITLQWVSQNPTILTVSTDGTITAVTQGNTQVGAQYPGPRIKWTPVTVPAADRGDGDGAGGK